MDKATIQRINSTAEISWKDIQRAGVRIRKRLIEKLGVQESRRFPGVYIWDLEYSPFIGYMEAVLKRDVIDKDACAII